MKVTIENARDPRRAYLQIQAERRQRAMREAKTMNQSEAHTALVNEVLKRYGREPDLVLWRNSKVRMVRGQPRAMPGLCTGASDIVGIVACDLGTVVDGDFPYGVLAIGRFIALEAKTGDAKPTREQRMFLELVRKKGGFAAVFRSVEEFGACIERARMGGSE